MKKISILHWMLPATLLICPKTYSQAPTSGLVAHYTFNQTLANLVNGGSDALTFNDVSYVFDAQAERYVLRVVGRGFTIPPAEWETSIGPGGYVRIPRPVISGNQATFSISILERGYSQWHGSSFLNVHDTSTAAGISLIGSGYFIDPALKGLYFGTTKIAPSEGAFTFNEFNGSGGGITIDDPKWTSYQIVFDEGNAQVFREGSLLGATIAELPSTGDLWIGIGWWDNGNAYATRLIADVSDIHVYDRALNSQEITSLAASVVPEPSTYALLLLSGAASLWALKRRKS